MLEYVEREKTVQRPGAKWQVRAIGHHIGVAEYHRLHLERPGIAGLGGAGAEVQPWARQIREHLEQVVGRLMAVVGLRAYRNVPPGLQEHRDAVDDREQMPAAAT